MNMVSQFYFLFLNGMSISLLSHVSVLALWLFMQEQHLARVPKSTFPWKKKAAFHPHPEDCVQPLSARRSMAVPPGLGRRGMVRQAGSSLTVPWHLKESQAGWGQQQGAAAVQGPPGLTIETSQAQGQDRSFSQGSTGSVRYKATRENTHSIARARAWT